MHSNSNVLATLQTGSTTEHRLLCLTFKQSPLTMKQLLEAITESIFRWSSGRVFRNGAYSGANCSSAACTCCSILGHTNQPKPTAPGLIYLYAKKELREWQGSDYSQLPVPTRAQFTAQHGGFAGITESKRKQQDKTGESQRAALK